MGLPTIDRVAFLDDTILIIIIVIDGVLLVAVIPEISMSIDGLTSRLSFLWPFGAIAARVSGVVG